MAETGSDCFYLCKNDDDEYPFCVVDGDLDDFIFFDEPVKLKSEK